MTDRDYADMVNPYARMEDEAYKRGYWAAIFDLVYVVIIVVIVTAILLAAACTPLDNQIVQGWPQITTYEHVVPHAAMRERCAKYTDAVVSPEGCAEIDLTAKRCDIWLSSDFPSTYSREHEVGHCAGKEHPGEHTLANLLKGAG